MCSRRQESASPASLDPPRRIGVATPQVEVGVAARPQTWKSSEQTPGNSERLEFKRPKRVWWTCSEPPVTRLQQPPRRGWLGDLPAKGPLPQHGVYPLCQSLDKWDCYVPPTFAKAGWARSCGTLTRPSYRVTNGQPSSRQLKCGLSRTQNGKT